MKIYQMTGLLEGGAANGAKQLTSALDQKGVDVQLIYPAKFPGQVDSGNDSLYQSAHWKASPLKRLASAISFRLHRQAFKKMARRRPPGHEIFSSPIGAAHTPWPPKGIEPSGQDIIHLHWIAKLIDYESFFASIPSEQPVVWTLHDMNPLAGGCHFSEGCQEFKIGCPACPQLAEIDKHRSAEYFKTKADLLKDIQQHVVAPSRWLIEQARQSPIFENARSFQRIPYGLSDEVHAAAMDQSEARRNLEINDEAFVFAFGAADVSNHRKGARFLKPALDKLARSVKRPVEGLVFGGGEFADSPVPLRQLGYLKSNHEKMQVYCAADVFIIPSTEDNLPFTGLEAMAGGAALLGFDVSGVPDLVIEGQTGRLAKPRDGDDLGKKLCEMAMDRDSTATQGRNAKEIARSTYVESKEADAYVELYQKILRDP